MIVREVTAAVGRLGLAGQSVLVAVSGGIDSITLAHALHGLHERERLKLSIGHVNHGLRGEESEADEAAVRGLAAGLGLPVPRGVVARSLRELEGHDLDYPLALKLCSPGILHKTDVGGVALDLEDGAALKEAFIAMRERHPDTPLLVVGRLVSRTETRAEAEAEVRLPSGAVSARGTVLLARPPKAITASWEAERLYFTVD